MKLKRFLKILLRKDFYTKTQYDCLTETHGNPGAAFTICPDEINENSVVYSFGIGTDISFDISITDKYILNIYAFDPTPRSLDWLKTQKLPKNFGYYDFGIASFDGEASFFSPKNTDNVSYSMEKNTFVSSDSVRVKVHRLKTIMGMLRHKKIDILKMDIEGAEYDVITDIVKSDIEIGQLLVEFHHRLISNGLKKTKQSIQELNDADYKIFNVSDNGEELSFMKV
jgi:FkbM family methyltransferase